MCIDPMGKFIHNGFMKRKKLPTYAFGTGRLDQLRVSVWVAVVCSSTHRVLLARRAPTTRNSGQWNFFGGGLDPGERPRKTALRELKEEAGIDATHQELIVLGEALTPNKRNILFALLQDDEFAPILNGESTHWEWVPLTKLSHRTDLHAPTEMLTECLLDWRARLPPVQHTISSAEIDKDDRTNVVTRKDNLLPKI